MGIGDKLLAKTANISVKASATPASSDTMAKTSPGRMLAVQSAVAAAEKRAAELESSLGKPIEVPLADIVEVPQRRRKLTEEQYGELKANLQKNPLVHPITLFRHPDGTLELIAGHNRFHIFEELGRPTIPAIFVDLRDSEEHELAAFYSNLLSPSLPDFEKFEGFYRHQQHTGLSQREIATAAGVSEAQLTKLFAYSRLPDEALQVLREAPDSSCLGANAAYELATLVAERPDRRPRVVEAVGRLAKDPRFTQKQALAFVTATEKTTRTAPEIRTIKQGKKQVCTVTTRNGVIAFRFKDATDALKWEARLAEYLENEITQHKDAE
jgi:ParB family chromosome partitioning protein